MLPDEFPDTVRGISYVRSLPSKETVGLTEPQSKLVKQPSITEDTEASREDVQQLIAEQEASNCRAPGKPFFGLALKVVAAKTAFPMSSDPSTISNMAASQFTFDHASEYFGPSLSSTKDMYINPLICAGASAQWRAGAGPALSHHYALGSFTSRTNTIVPSAPAFTLPETTLVIFELTKSAES
jgi:hypothetical protein